MFKNHDIEQLVDIDKIASHISGSEIDNKKIQMVKDAVREINKKTRKSFGFAIFSNPRGQVKINNPKIELQS